MAGPGSIHSADCKESRTLVPSLGGESLERDGGYVQDANHRAQWKREEVDSRNVGTVARISQIWHHSSSDVISIQSDYRAPVFWLQRPIEGIVKWKKG